MALANLSAFPPSQDVRDPPNLHRRTRPSVPARDQPLKESHPRPAAAPQPTVKVENRSSSMSLFNLFSKPKVEQARGHHEPDFEIPTLTPAPPLRQPPRPPIAPPSPIIRVARPDPPSPVVRSGPTEAPVDPREETTRASRRLSGRPMSTAPRSRPATSVEPPPLSRAYREARRLGRLCTTAAPAESLLRANSQRSQHGARHDTTAAASDAHLPSEPENPSRPDGRSRERLSKGRKRFSMAVTAAELTPKIYVLVADQLLQYAEQGCPDRLPEKVLRLTKESVAYASDVIPGKHWVLQVLQAANDDGSLATSQHRSLRARLHLRSAAAKRVAASYLLVFDGAEDMDYWLTGIKKEIEGLGGKRVRTETPSGERPDPAAQGPRPSRRGRDPMDRSSVRVSASLSSIASPVTPGSDRSRRESGFVTDRDVASGALARGLADTSSTDRRALTSRPNGLGRREKARLSYVSNATSITVGSTGSRSSSPAPPSPRSESQSSDTDMEVHQLAMTRVPKHTNSGSLSHRRWSVQPLPITEETDAVACSPDGADAEPSRATSTDSASPISPAQGRPGGLTRNFSRPNIRSAASDQASTPDGGSSAPPAQMLLQNEPRGETQRETVRPPSIVGNLPDLSDRSPPRAVSSNRLSFRPVPIRVSSADHADRGSVFIAPKRVSSIGALATFAGASSGGAIHPSTTATAMSTTPESTPPLSQTPSQQSLRRLSQASSISSTFSHPPTPAATTMLPLRMNPIAGPPPSGPPPPTPQAKNLRRPPSLRIRTDPTPFLATSRPSHSTSSSTSSTAPAVPTARALMVRADSSTARGSSIHTAQRVSLYKGGVAVRTGSETSLPSAGSAMRPLQLQGKRLSALTLPPPTQPPNGPLPPLPTGTEVEVQG